MLDFSHTFCCMSCSKFTSYSTVSLTKYTAALSISGSLLVADLLILCSFLRRQHFQWVWVLVCPWIQSKVFTVNSWDVKMFILIYLKDAALAKICKRCCAIMLIHGCETKPWCGCCCTHAYLSQRQNCTGYWVTCIDSSCDLHACLGAPLSVGVLSLSSSISSTLPCIFWYKIDNICVFFLRSELYWVC